MSRIVCHCVGRCDVVRVFPMAGVGVWRGADQRFERVTEARGASAARVGVFPYASRGFVVGGRVAVRAMLVIGCCWSAFAPVLRPECEIVWA